MTLFYKEKKLKKIHKHTSAFNKKTTKATSLDAGNCPITVLNEGRFTNQHSVHYEKIGEIGFKLSKA